MRPLNLFTLTLSLLLTTSGVTHAGIIGIVGDVDFSAQTITWSGNDFGTLNALSGVRWRIDLLPKEPGTDSEILQPFFSPSDFDDGSSNTNRLRSGNTSGDGDLDTISITYSRSGGIDLEGTLDVAAVTDFSSWGASAIGNLAEVIDNGGEIPVDVGASGGWSPITLQNATTGSAVPEPSGLLLFCLCVVGLVGKSFLNRTRTHKQTV